MEIALLFGLIILNGIFAMSEIALVMARKARLQKLINAGDHAAKAAVELGNDPTKFLSTVQIGITSIGVMNGIVGEAALAGPLSTGLTTLGIPSPHAGYLATGFVIVTITYFTIVLGELVPKRLGQINPESIARLVARPMMLLATLAKPFVFLLSASTQLLLRLFGIKDIGRQPLTAEELYLVLEEGSQTGVIEQQEHQMVKNVFRLDDRQIASLMVPRSEVIHFDADESLEENLQRFGMSPHSRFPVVRGNWNDVLGMASARQILAQTLRGEQPNLIKDLQPAVFVPESLTGMELLEEFKNSSVQMIIVVDEYGEVQGIVTLQDVLEAITGEFVPHKIEESWAVHRDDGSWLLDGLIPIPELKDRLRINAVPEEERGRYHTLSGMMMLLLGKIPQTGDRCEWENWIFEIVDLDGFRIDKVLAAPKPAIDEKKQGA
ncbi:MULTISPECIES: hemolysin family protein [Nitrosomonas]|uniref:Membrane protein n=1 Tax=Nitrosomonas communis TaxID=44574 RepID=A0A0F7KER2_9PROT|nr:MULTISPECIES: hemolysin family protein [Nitrosomonas]AKH37653.1 membrane protein [Nitrosomonas communis]TYP83847.1 putative hemolysin [Nitrosomonas communis]UVS62954.1 hemolysin family protein [Nitrosomonas sp. PLL12]